MNIKIRNEIILYAINIAICLCKDLDSTWFKLYNYNHSKNLKFTSSFESMYLLESYSTKNQKFDLLKCLSQRSKNLSAKVFTYEVNNLTVNCKSYSQLNFLPDDIQIAESTINSMIYLRNGTVSGQSSSGNNNNNSINFNCKLIL